MGLCIFCLKYSSQENVLKLPSTRVTALNNVEQMLIAWETTSVVTMDVVLSAYDHSNPPQRQRRRRRPLRLLKKKVKYGYLLTKRVKYEQWHTQRERKLRLKPTPLIHFVLSSMAKNYLMSKILYFGITKNVKGWIEWKICWTRTKTKWGCKPDYEWQKYFIMLYKILYIISNKLLLFVHMYFSQCQQNRLRKSSLSIQT